MKEVTISFSKWYHWLLASLPLLAILGSAILWVDARHMHTDIANIRYIDLQISIIEGHIRDYSRLNNPGSADEIYYNLDVDQLNKLKSERSRELGLGGLPK